MISLGYYWLQGQCDITRVLELERLLIREQAATAVSVHKLRKELQGTTETMKTGRDFQLYLPSCLHYYVTVFGNVFAEVKLDRARRLDADMTLVTHLHLWINAYCAIIDLAGAYNIRQIV